MWTGVHELPRAHNLSYPSGAHGCVAEIDPETGEVHILRYVAIDDCGVVINPQLARGQIHGGVIQGIAQALFEEVRYGDDGQPLTSTLVDYSIPSAPDMPPLETSHLEIRTSGNELGAKGLGEARATAAPRRSSTQSWTRWRTGKSARSTCHSRR